MHEIFLETPQVCGSQVDFRWRVDPPSELCRRLQFGLRFPDSVPIADLPERVWWWVALACLHPQWALLEPCRVHLPVRLAPGEGDVWLGLVAAARASLDAHIGGALRDPRVEIVEEGPVLAPLALPAERGRCASAFSGGKDSLLQAGLLAELTERPVLVSTTSPMPKLEDHTVPRRRQVFREIVRRLPVEWVEVESDYRSSYRNRFSVKAGFGVTVNELTDTMLYVGALVPAGLALGATHFFLASETEVQESVERDGQIVQHPHAMYATTTLRGLAAALDPALRLGSLTVPLHAWQVQRLLWTRYVDIADLQFSCWKARGRQAACSACGECLRVAYGVLAAGGRPSAVGLDLRRLLVVASQWPPRLSPDPRGLPQGVVRRSLHGQAARLIADTPLERVAADLRRSWLPPRLDRAAGRALDTARRLKERMQEEKPPPLQGFRAGFERQLDPLLRERAAAIYRENFEPEEPAGYAGSLERSEALAARLVGFVRANRETLRA